MTPATLHTARVSGWSLSLSHTHTKIGPALETASLPGTLWNFPHLGGRGGLPQTTMKR